jgi:peroxiredoxin
VSRLQNGQQFPSLSLPVVGGGTISLPHDLAGSFGIVLIYRGSWCPYCSAQLAAFSRASEALAELDAQVVALSVDDESTGAGLVEKHRLKFPIAHSADVDKVAELTGAYISPDRSYLQSTGFVLDPEGAVITAVYSSEAIGRLVADDVIGFLRYVKAHED